MKKITIHIDERLNNFREIVEVKRDIQLEIIGVPDKFTTEVIKRATIDLFWKYFNMVNCHQIHRLIEIKELKWRLKLDADRKPLCVTAKIFRKTDKDKRKRKISEQVKDAKEKYYWRHEIGKKY